MYTVKIEASFSSAHNLRNYKGKCESLHGHNWKVELSASKRVLNKTGMVMDFKELKNILHGVIDKLDHAYLNEHVYFKKVNPTSENIAKFIYDGVKKEIKPAPARISVTVWENPGASATYEG